MGAQESALPAMASGEVDPHYEAEPRQAEQDAHPLAVVLHIKDVPHVLVTGEASISLVAVRQDRRFGPPLELACQRPMAAAVGDIRGNGREDLVVACRETYGDGECSWVYWGGEEGFEDARRTRLTSTRACDVAVADLDGDGCDDIVLCQNRTFESYTTESLIYRGRPDGVFEDPVRLATEDARRVFLARSPSEKPPALVFVNHWSRKAARGVSSYVYYGGADGFSAERRAEVQGERAVDSVCCDINDDGYVDLVLVNSSLSTIAQRFRVLRISEWPEWPSQRTQHRPSHLPGPRRLLCRPQSRRLSRPGVRGSRKPRVGDLPRDRRGFRHGSS